MPKQSPSAFAAQIKAKYPVYASIPDAELTAKVLAKYPVYRDQVGPEPAVDPALTPQWTPPAPPAPDAGAAPSGVLSGLGDAVKRVGSGALKPLKVITDQVQQIGKDSSDAVLRGDLHGALQTLIAPITGPLQGIVAQGGQLADTLKGKPQMSGADASLMALEQLGVPAFSMKDSLDRRDYLDLLGQGLGAGVMFKAPQVAAKKFQALGKGPTAPPPVLKDPPVSTMPKAEMIPEAPPAPITVTPSKPPVPPKPLKARDLREEFAARPTEQATDLLSELKRDDDFSGKKDFRKEPDTTPLMGGKKGGELKALGAKGPRTGWNQKGEINDDLLLALGAGAGGAALGAASGDSPLDALLKGAAGAAGGAILPSMLRSPRLRNEIGALGKLEQRLRSALSEDEFGELTAAFADDRAAVSDHGRSAGVPTSTPRSGLGTWLTSPAADAISADPAWTSLLGKARQVVTEKAPAPISAGRNEQGSRRTADMVPQIKGQPGLRNESGALDTLLGVRTGAAVAGAAYGAATGEDSDEQIGRAVTFGGLALAPTLFLKGKATAVPSAPRTGILQDPTVAKVLTPNRTERSMGERLRTSMAKMQLAFNRAMVFEHDLKSAGLHDAVTSVEKFNHQKIDAPKRIAEQIQSVIVGKGPEESLLGPGQYRDFSDIVRLRNMKEIAAMGGAVEEGMSAAQVSAALSQLEATASPNVLKAAERHKALVNDFGQVLVDKGILSSKAVRGKADYFPTVVMEFLKDSDAVIRTTISQPKPGSTKERKGTTLESQHDYIDTMSRYLSQMEDRIRKDDLVRDLMGTYDKLDPAKPLPAEHVIWAYGGDTYGIPKALAMRLDHVTARDPNATRFWESATSMWKNITLRAAGVPYHITNFAGDMANLYASEPLTALPALPGRLAKAAIATRMKNQPDSANPYLLKLQQIARQADTENLGTGAASGELGSVVRQKPEVLQAVGASRPRIALAKAEQHYDAFNEWRENVPRLAKWMAEVDRGQTPAKAAKITREQLIDYTSLTDFERTKLKAFWFPFFTFFKKNFENWQPWKQEGESLGQAAARTSSRYAKVLVPAVAATMWNETHFPEAEHSLPDYKRYQFHLLLPSWGKDGKQEVTYIGFPGPANAAAKMVGLGGAVQRTADLASGRTTPKEELERIGPQMWENWAGLLNPAISLIGSAGYGRDLRTGYDIYPKNATPKEKLKAVGTKALDLATPMAQVMRASGDTEGAQATVGALAKRMTTGNLVTTEDVAGARVKQKLNTLNDAQTQVAQDTRAAKSPAVAQMAATYLQPNGALKMQRDFLAAQRMKGVEGNLFQSIVLAAAMDAARSDARLRPMADKLRLLNEAQQINRREAPTAVELLQRRELDK